MRLPWHRAAPPEPDRLAPETARALLAEIDLPTPYPGVAGGKSTVWDQQKCQFCGGLHTRTCPRVKRIVYRDNNTPAEVEFWPHGRWPTDEVIWLEDVHEAAGGGSDGQP